MDIKEFVKKRKYLFWYIKDTDNLSQESIIEHILNYGDWNDFKELINIVGINSIAEIFRIQSQKQRNNYRPKIKNFFELYFDEHAPRSVK